MNSIFRRVSIRKYQEKKIEQEKVEQLLRAAMAAPSACNQQREELALPFQSFSQNAKEQEKLKVSLTFPTQPLTINLSFLSNQSYKIS